MIVREKNTGMQNVVCLPVRFDKIWLGKTLTLAIMLFGMHLLLWLITTVMGLRGNGGVTAGWPHWLHTSFLDLFMADPFYHAVGWFYGIPSGRIWSSRGQCALSAFGTEKAWFLLNPYAIPARIVCPFFKIHHNGLLLNNSSLCSLKALYYRLWQSALLALLVYLCSSKLFRKGGGGCA